MEGAAVAQVCAHQQVPFLELRGISNLVEDRDLARWDLKTGAETAQRAVQALLAGWHGSKVPA
jgi:futalosine hydrolase